MNAPSQALQTRSEPMAPTVAQTDAASLMEVISRAASDPNTDVDKLERLMALYERITGKQAEVAFNDAMNAAQAAMRRIRTDKHNSQTHSDYATYAAIDRMARPIYTAQGFSLSFNTEPASQADYVRVTCRVAHAGGHAEHYGVDMPADGKGAKGGDVMTKTHATGSAMTYGQRYLMKLIFNLAIGEDDDGNFASVREMSEAAKGAIAVLNGFESAVELGAWKKNNADKLRQELPAGEFSEVVSLYNRRVEAMKSRSDDHGA